MILKTISSFNLKTIIFMSISLGECQHLFVLILFVTLPSKTRKSPLSWFHHLWFIKKCQYIWLKNHLLNHPSKYARTYGEPSKVLVTPSPSRESVQSTELAYMQCYKFLPKPWASLWYALHVFPCSCSESCPLCTDYL